MFDPALSAQDRTRADMERRPKTLSSRQKAVKCAATAPGQMAGAWRPAAGVVFEEFRGKRHEYQSDRSAATSASASALSGLGIRLRVCIAPAAVADDYEQALR